MTNEETLKSLYNEHFKHQNNNISIVDWLKKIEIEVQKNQKDKANIANIIKIKKVNDQSYEVNLYRNGNVSLTIVFKNFQDAIKFINGDRKHENA